MPRAELLTLSDSLAMVFHRFCLCSADLNCFGRMKNLMQND